MIKDKLYKENYIKPSSDIDQMFDGQSYLKLKKIFMPLFKLLYQPKIIGADNIPLDKPIIFAGNHRHIFDPLFVCIATKRVVYFMAKKELHEAFYGGLFKLAQTIPVNRDQKDPYAMDVAYHLLKRKEAIGIMPEGKINYSEQLLLPLKYGAVALAKKTNALIVPFGIIGSYRAFKYDMRIQFAKPLDISSIDLSEANEILRSNIIELLKVQE